MKKIGDFEIPETGEEFCAFKPQLVARALAQKVLCVMVTRPEGKWTAYVDAVPGVRHEDEKMAVAESGNKLPERLARAIFGFVPEELPYAP